MLQYKILTIINIKVQGFFMTNVCVSIFDNILSFLYHHINIKFILTTNNQERKQISRSIINMHLQFHNNHSCIFKYISEMLDFGYVLKTW